jgi:ADP-L-glycero-D-manno-heptose 6-epimerase
VIAVTGAAGFIGSNIVHQLNRRGRSDLIVVDVHATDEGNANLAPLQYERYLTKDDFRTWFQDVDNARQVEALYHMGACSSTTETDAAFLDENNFGYTRDLCLASLAGGVRFINASSAATYGDGAQGYSDDHACLDDLKPLNLYAKSKQDFDLWAGTRACWTGSCA